jgi:5-oxoprolinase (ATP-hydrolysing) subunit A
MPVTYGSSNFFPDMLSVDLNCDMGEGMSNDADIMPYISSVNIACGAHAGDAAIMQQTIELALKYNTAIGAHPGFADKANFGRTELQLSDESYYDLVREQLLLLQKLIDAAGATMHHVKPHGALYNMSAVDYKLASIIAMAVKDHNPNLILYGLSNSHSINAATAAGLRAASEVFADRTYMNDSTLTPRTNAAALITNETRSAQQVLQMIRQQTATSLSGKTITVKAETICIHGDSPNAPAFAKLIATQLRVNNILVQTL